MTVLTFVVICITIPLLIIPLVIFICCVKLVNEVLDNNRIYRISEKQIIERLDIIENDLYGDKEKEMNV